MSKQSKNIRLIQDFIVPALDEQTYGDLLEWDSELMGVFKIKWTHKARSSWTEEDSRVFIAWDLLKGRPVPKTHQEFVDSKQRLRAALRNLKTIEDVPCNDDYRRYRITDILDIRVKTERKVDIKTEVKHIPVLPRRSRRKVKIEKCMYDEDSDESWTESIKPQRKPRRSVSRRKAACAKEIGECSKSAFEPSEKNPGAPNFKQFTEEEIEGHLEQKIIPIPTKETGAIPKIKVTASSKETCAKTRLPRSLACILQSNNIDYDRNVGPRRKTKVSQEVWASSLVMKQEPAYSPEEKQIEPISSMYQQKQSVPNTKISADGEKTSNDSVPAPETSDKIEKKSEDCVPTTEVSVNCEEIPKANVPTAEASVKPKKKSKGGRKKKKSTSEPLKIKIPLKQEPVQDYAEKLEARAPSPDNAKPHDEQEPVEKVTKKKEPVKRNPFSNDPNSMYSEAYLATRLDEDYLTKAWLENDRECPWFCGKGSSDVVFEIEYPEFNSPDFNAPLTALGVRLDALEKLSGFLKKVKD